MARKDTPSTTWQLPILRGEPDLGPLEHAYRQYTLKDDVNQLIVIGWIYIAAALVNGFIDYQLFGVSAQLITLYLMRGVIVAGSLAAMWFMSRSTSYHQVDWIVLLWTLVIVAFALYVHYTRLDSFFSNALVNLIFVVVFYTATPNRFHFRLIPALLLSVGEIALAWSAHVSAIDVRSLTVAMIAGNLTGMVISVHLYTYRRKQFKAQYEEHQARKEIEHLAMTDALTQTLNRRRFMELAEGEFQRFQHYQHSFSLLIMDLDHFKRINDTFGHSAGDSVLKGFANIAGSLIRQSDFLGRLGGEEFAILLPATLAPDALRLAARIREGCEQMTLPTRSGVIQFTTSIGVTEVHSGDLSIDDTFHRADQALYHVKDNGRNSAHLI